MRLFNFHTHTTFCDGHAPAERFVEAALNAGMHSLGFSAHAPVEPGYAWCIPKEKLREYAEKIGRLKKENAGKINLYCGLEADFVPGYTRSFADYRKELSLDYIIGSVHLVQKEGVDEVWFIDGPESNYVLGLEMIFQNDIRNAVRHYFEQTSAMVVTEKPDVVGHFDKIKMNNKGRFFSEEEEWYLALVKESLDVLKNSGCILEVNTRGKYKNRTKDFFPSVKILQLARERGIPLTLSTDAHQPEEVALLLGDAAEMLKELGFSEVLCYEGSSWNPVSL